MEQTFNEQLKTYQQAAEDYLSRCFTDETLPQQTLFEAMRYSLLAGGKRIRPVLVLAPGTLECVLPRPVRHLEVAALGAAVIEYTVPRIRLCAHIMDIRRAEHCLIVVQSGDFAESRITLYAV